jgi:hypothetical protein
MLMTGKEALNLDTEKSDNFDDSLFYKLEAGNSVNIVFLGGIDGIVSWVQHNWWKNDKYGKNPNGYEVTENVIFTSLKEKWTDTNETCPGFIVGSEGEQKWAANILVDDGSGQKEKVFFFGKAIWTGIVNTYRSIQADFGDDADIGDKWLRVSNSGVGATRYSVQFNGKPFKDYASYTPKHDVTEYIKTYTFSEAVEMMDNAGLPILERLKELDLDTDGNPVAKTEVVKTPVTE